MNAVIRWIARSICQIPLFAAYILAARQIVGTDNVVSYLAVVAAITAVCTAARLALEEL